MPHFMVNDLGSYGFIIRVYVASFYGVAARYLRALTRSIDEITRVVLPLRPHLAEEYNYEPLPGDRYIRLLTLQRCSLSGNEEVCCDMKVVCLDDKPEFRAVSHAWGNQYDTRTIRCAGKRVKISSNLYSFLLHRRHPYTDFTLWIDALCINQKDDSEKSRQVQMMGDIYSSSQHAWVWLGEETEETKWAIECLRLGQSLAQAFTSSSNSSDAGAKIVSAVEEFEWRPLVHLLQSPWFTRKWVLQEVINAPRVYAFVGYKYFDWAVFETVINLLATRREIALNPIFRDCNRGLYNANVLLAARHRRHHSDQVTNGLRLLYLLLRTQHMECSDIRDRFFALENLVVEARKDNWTLKPDYSLSVVQVFKKFASWMTEEVKSIQFLSYVGSPTDDPLYTAFPSWLPRFDQHGGNYPLGDDVNLFRASGSSKLDGHLSNDGSVLNLRGKLVDEICVVEKLPNRTIQGIPESSSISKSWALAMQDRRRLQRAKQIAVGQTAEFSKEIFQQFWRTMLCDRYMDEVDFKFRRAEDEFGDKIARWMDYVEGSDYVATEAPCGITQNLEFVPIIQSIRVGAWGGKVFCKSREGRFCQAPVETQIGDKICVFFGGEVPFIVRARGDGSFTFIGECYCHGIMDGEVVEMEEIAVEIIALK